jgi:hypothetical protein
MIGSATELRPRARFGLLRWEERGLDTGTEHYPPSGTHALRAAARWSRAVTFLAPITLGILTFVLVAGPKILRPKNVAWLEHHDARLHQTGWEFFRRSDWSLPLAANPDFGLEFSSSVLFTDSNVLLALLFKPLDGLLPEPFQYFGWWLLLCVVLQTLFGWKLVGLVTSSFSRRLLGTAFFAFAPPMIWRFQGHANLAAHFLILAGLYLALRPQEKRRWWAWALLVVISSLVHAYLLAMVLMLWLADIGWTLLEHRQSPAETFRELVAIAGVLGFTMWHAGYFMNLDGASDWGFGYFRMNVAAPFDSAGWSYVLPTLPTAAGDYEGFNFLGAGGLLLLVAAIPALVRGRTTMVMRLLEKNALLGLALFGSTVFALSNRIGIAHIELAYPIPRAVESTGNVLRSSGRFFWPVYYVLLLFLVFVVIRRFRSSVAITILAVALAVQVADTSAGWLDIRRQLTVEPAQRWATPLEDDFWKAAAARYDAIRIIPPQNGHPDWRIFSDYAVRHGLATDAAFFARVSLSDEAGAREHADELVRSGRFEEDTLYVVDASVIGEVRQNIDESRDLLLRVDGFDLVAPGGAGRFER